MSDWIPAAAADRKFVAQRCKGEMTRSHASNEELKACAACFPVDPEIFCADCKYWAQTDGDYGICCHCSPFLRGQHRINGCMGYVARAAVAQ